MNQIDHAALLSTSKVCANAMMFLVVVCSLLTLRKGLESKMKPYLVSFLFKDVLQT